MEFDAIYHAYFQSVYLYIRQLSGDEHIAEEITSDTFFKAMKSIKDFRGECDMRVWLCQIAKNTYYSYLKKNERVISVDEAELQNIVAPDAFIEDWIGMQEEAQQIRRILHELADPYKEVFMLRVFGELPFSQIGELFGKTDSWARLIFYRAKKQLQEAMK